MGNRVNRFLGVPVLFTSRVIDDTRASRFSEKNRRFINVNPLASSKKIHAANDLIALTYGALPEEYDKSVVSRQDTERCKQIIWIIVANLKHHSAYRELFKEGSEIYYLGATSCMIIGNEYSAPESERLLSPP